MPLVNKTFDQLLDFTRTTSATFVGSNGLVQTTPASANLLTWTQQFDNAAWGIGATTVTANATVAPDGTSTADKVIATAVAGYHVKNQLVTVTSGVSYTLSFYVKAAEYTKVYFCDAQSGKYACSFDLAAVTAGTPTGSYTGKSASIESAGNGWYRCELQFIPTATEASRPSATGYPDTGATLTNFGASYTGDGTSGIFIWGAQLEAASAATTYTRNNGGVFPPRFDYDPVTLAAKGLLIEEQRTNLQIYSGQMSDASWSTSNLTVTANAAASPDGTLTATLAVQTTGTPFIRRVASVTANTTYTTSVYAKAFASTNFVMVEAGATGSSAAFVLSGAGSVVVTNLGGATSATITSVGNGWYRCTLTYTTGAAQTTLFINNQPTSCYLWGAQLEAGAFATSYIPTVASQVTRTADQTSIVAPNFASWYNQSEGTVVWEGDFYAYNSNRLFAIDAGPSSRTCDVYTNSPSSLVYYKTSDAQQLSLGTALANTVLKMAVAIKFNDYNGAINGTLGGSDTATGAVAVADRLSIGHWNNGGFLNGHVRSIRYYPVRLSNTQLQALTS